MEEEIKKIMFISTAEITGLVLPSFLNYFGMEIPISLCTLYYTGYVFYVKDVIKDYMNKELYKINLRHSRIRTFSK
jgi:hypothetical protein